jgi:hypothetical protein
VQELSPAAQCAGRVCVVKGLQRAAASCGGREDGGLVWLAAEQALGGLCWVVQIVDAMRRG